MADFTGSEKVVYPSNFNSGGGGPSTPVGGPGSGSNPPMDNDVNIRLGKVETAIEGLRHGQIVMIGVVGILTAAMIAFGIYGLQRSDAIDQRIADLPGKISTDLRDLTSTLASSITAARSGQPQVIIMPAPQQGTSPREGTLPQQGTSMRPTK